MINRELWKLKKTLRVFLNAQGDKFDKDTTEFRNLIESCEPSVSEKMYDLFDGSIIVVSKQRHDECVRVLESYGWKTFAKKRPKTKNFNDPIYIYMRGGTSGGTYFYVDIKDFTKKGENSFIYFTDWKKLNEHFDTSDMKKTVSSQSNGESNVEVYEKNEIKEK